MDFYVTIRYDGNIEVVKIIESEPQVYPSFSTSSDIYQQSGMDEGRLNTLSGQCPSGVIQDLTNSSFTVMHFWPTIDTTEIVNNSYSIIETSEYSFYERIEESDIPTSNQNHYISNL